MAPGMRLKQYRKERAVSSTLLAAELGRSKSFVSRLERRDVPPVEFAECIAAIERIVARRQVAMTPIEQAVSEIGEADDV